MSFIVNGVTISDVMVLPAWHDLANITCHGCTDRQSIPMHSCLFAARGIGTNTGFALHPSPDRRGGTVA